MKVTLELLTSVLSCKEWGLCTGFAVDLAGYKTLEESVLVRVNIHIPLTSSFQRHTS